MDWTLVFAALFFALIPIIIYIKKCVLNYSLFKKVGWIITPNRERSLHDRCGTSLLDIIIINQQDLEIPREYRLSRDNKAEIEYTKEILGVFKNYVSEEYFGGYLLNTQAIRNLHDDWYFMYSLFVFTEKYAQYDNYELREKIYKYESRNGPYYTHSLTDYGRTFYKIYLISLLFVESNPYTSKLYKHIMPQLKEHIKSYLDSNHITFWSYRP